MKRIRTAPLSCTAIGTPVVWRRLAIITCRWQRGTIVDNSMAPKYAKVQPKNPRHAGKWMRCFHLRSEVIPEDKPT